MGNITLVPHSATLIQEPNLLKAVEAAGRTCYKSEANITHDSATRFCTSRITEGHLAMLEFARITFDCTDLIGAYDNGFKAHKYLETTVYSVPGPKGLKSRMLVSGNARAINESGEPQLIAALSLYNPVLGWGVQQNGFVMPEQVFAKVVNLSDYDDLIEAELEAHGTLTFRCVTNRGVSHELVRHRPVSFAHESTRYVNYEAGIGICPHVDWDQKSVDTRAYYLQAWNTTATVYAELIENGEKPQEARAVLPNELRTEIVLCANLREWVHFFNLRYKGTTGKPHPDMQHLASLMWEEAKKDPQAFDFLQRHVAS